MAAEDARRADELFRLTTTSRSPAFDEYPIFEARAQREQAFHELIGMFATPVEGAKRPQLDARFLAAISAYERFVTEAFSQELQGDERRKLIFQGLRAEGVIDPDDDKKAGEQYRILDRGVNLNREFFRKLPGLIASAKQPKGSPEDIPQS